MKNVFKFFMPMAAAVIAFASCVEEKPFPDADAVKITVHAVPDDLQGEPKEVAQTKTYISGNAILWGTGEYMKLCVHSVADATENLWANSTDASADLYDGEDQALFEFGVSPQTADSYTYLGLYPASAAVASSNTNPANYKVNLPAVQNATASSYDPAAYILVAKPESFNDVQTDWQASFRRATALNKITLKNLPSGISIKKVKITASEGNYLAGRRYFDLTASTAAGQRGEIYSGGGRTESVEIKYATALSHEGEGEWSADVWFTSWDVELTASESLTIVVYTTNKKSYTKTINLTGNQKITFKEGYLNTLGVKEFSGITPEDVNEIDEGDYVILAANNTTYYALKAQAEGTSSRMDFESYTGSLASYNGSSSIIWTVAKDTLHVNDNVVDVYTISNNGSYLGWDTGNAAKLQEAGNDWTKTNYAMDIDWKNNDHYEINIHSTTSRILAKNTNSTNGFAFYAGSGYKNIIFVPATVDNRTPVTLAFESDAAEFTNAKGSYDQFPGYDVTATAGENDITNTIASALVWSKEDDDDVIDEWDNGVLTLTGNVGTATVKVSFPGNETYMPAEEVSYTITVTDASTPPTPITGWLETSLSNISTSDVFVIVGNDAYTISNAQSTSAAPAAATLASASVTISGTAPNRSLSGTIPASVKWTLTGNNTDGYTFYSNANSSYHLYNSTTADTKSNDAMRVGNPSSGTDRSLFILDDGNHLVTKDSFTARYLACYTTTPDWRGYVSSSTSETTITFYKYVAAPDNREEAGMSWSSDSATATYSTGNNLSFTAPTLTSGNASGITYESTDETIATINASGVVSITALSDNNVKEGNTTIKAVFAGDDDYKPQTVSYTLTVVDSRTAATTPTFSPAAGEVTANQVVTFQPTDQGLTFHYTVNGTDPVVGTSSTGASVTIDAAKTVKVIATKTGYKPSAVASAAYTIAGVVEAGTLSNPYTVAEAIAAYQANSSIGSKYVKGIVCQEGSSYCFISDDGTTTNKFELYGFSNSDVACSALKVGDAVIAHGTLDYYSNNSMYEINGTYVDVHISKPVLTPNGGNFVGSQSVSIASTNSSSIRYTTDGTAPTVSAGEVYSSAFNLTASATVKAVGIDENEVICTAVASATFTKLQTYAVTWSAPSNGSITVKNGETTLSSGALVPETATVSITVAPADGYALSTLVYNDGSDHDIKSAKSFTMPAHAVSITATFEATGGGGTTQLDEPASVAITAFSAAGFTATWANDANADSYSWMLSTSDTAPASTSDSSVKAYGTSSTASLTNGTWTLTKNGLSLDGVYYFYVKAVGTGSYSDSDYSSQKVSLLSFESAASTYSSNWTITTIVSQKSTITAHSGSYYANTDSKTTGSIQTASVIANPKAIKFFISKESTNEKTATWKVSVKTATATSWTQVGDDQAAGSGITRGSWTEVSRDLSSYSNVYVRIDFSGTTAVRCIDDVSLTSN